MRYEKKRAELTHRTGWKWCYYGISGHIESEKRFKRSVVIVGSSIFDSLLTVGQLLVGRVHFHFNCFPTNPTECLPNFTNSNARAIQRMCVPARHHTPHSIRFIFNRFKHLICDMKTISISAKCFFIIKMIFSLVHKLTVSMKPWIFYTWIHKDNARFTCLHAFSYLM